MAERTYGPHKHTLDEIEESSRLGGTMTDMAAHIRELQAELDEAKLQQLATASQAAELEVENAKLKAGRREFGMRVAARVNSYSEIPLHDATITAIVEQELNK